MDIKLAFVSFHAHPNTPMYIALISNGANPKGLTPKNLMK
ncbi:hypothetical protein VCHE16_0113 [Vibrio paracholerae HE-16]|nr:hypothetical protein VCHE16_0113 [Vibrio paracholerae HE-16]